MQISLSIHEIISWIVAGISLALFIYERRRNNLTPFYMNLQGLLKTCHTKAVFYWQVSKRKTEEGANNSENKNDSLMWDSVSADFEALKQTVMGIMKAVEPNKDTPFDVRDYTRLKEYPEDKVATPQSQ